MQGAFVPTVGIGRVLYQVMGGYQSVCQLMKIPMSMFLHDRSLKASALGVPMS